MEEQVEMVGRAFVDHYYLLFDSDRASLSSLYKPTSMLSFEGQKIFGADDICSKLNQLPFDQCKISSAIIDNRWHCGLCQRQPPTTGGRTPPKIQPDVSLDSNSTRKLLCPE